MRNSIRNSESPKLYSNSPAMSIAAVAASAVATSMSERDRATSDRKLTNALPMNHKKSTRAGSPRSAAMCMGTLCK